MLLPGLQRSGFGLWREHCLLYASRRGHIRVLDFTQVKRQFWPYVIALCLDRTLGSDLCRAPFGGQIPQVQWTPMDAFVTGSGPITVVADNLAPLHIVYVFQARCPEGILFDQGVTQPKK